MSSIQSDQAVHCEIHDRIAFVKIANPPVNAASHAVRFGLVNAVNEFSNRADIDLIVLIGSGRTFIAGADIREFGKPSQAPSLPDVTAAIEECPKPVLTALHGAVLGGGLEIALAAHYRIALATTQFGFPEVTLGLLPGAGGTQRLPRLAPMSDAIRLITTGAKIGAQEAQSLGVIDKIVEGEDLHAAALEFSYSIIRDGKPVRRTGDRPCRTPAPDVFTKARTMLADKTRGQIAPLAALEALEAAATSPFSEGLAKERALFLNLMASPQRQALIHAFFSERAAARPPELTGVDPCSIQTIGVIGGGTMGAGIATAALLAGFCVTLVEQNAEGAKQASDTVENHLKGAVKRGKLSEEAFETICKHHFQAVEEYDSLEETDLVIEAVFESMDVKRDVFTRLDEVCKEGTVLATNTSYLNLNEIAHFTKRPGDVVGLHFFSPAHVMRLLEVVPADATRAEVLATGFAVARRLGKVAVRAGVCDGFIGNRILAHYRKALDGAVLAGASPYDIDKALTEFGLAMGPYAVSDLSGLDIGWANRKRLAPSRDPRELYAEFADKLCEMERFGRKSGRGFYVYGEGGAEEDPEVLDIIAIERAAKGINPNYLDTEEIIARFMAAMINEAARVIEEGVAARPLDVDVTLINGYGFPRWRGGPMHYADTIGVKKVLEDIERFAKEDSFLWRPAPLLRQLAKDGQTFSSLNERRSP
ncbi:MAG: 3-hydroxyacyl-CoA dehydrogenase NAD-binding domain-containing protein [Pseudomonadota bacterium]